MNDASKDGQLQTCRDCCTETVALQFLTVLILVCASSMKSLCLFVNAFLFAAFFQCINLLVLFPTAVYAQAVSKKTLIELRVALGRSVFNDETLSRNGDTSCATCHKPEHAFADDRKTSIGTGGSLGTRNAPSLLGASGNTAFFWDGRRTALKDAVLDPFANPTELGDKSLEDVLSRLKSNEKTFALFRAAFPGDSDCPNARELADSLVAYIQSLRANNSQYNQFRQGKPSMTAMERRGKYLFESVAKCTVCHEAGTNTASFTDGQFHQSGIGVAEAAMLPRLAREVLSVKLTPSEIGARILSDANWSNLGRFVISKKPNDIGAFRTPSLRNVAVTAPYMHDGSISTLQEAVDYEIYYHSNSSGNPTNLTRNDRDAIVAFLGTLSDR